MMNIVPASIKGVSIVETAPFRDQRGLFYRAFCDQEMSQLLQKRVIHQVNISRTEVVGMVRGLHFQCPPYAEMKMVRCLKGRVWDVALDLRQNSPTFLKWFGTELSAQNTNMLIIPEGCAHGFQVLESGSELLYLHTASYEPKSEGGVRFDDPAINIRWPLAVTEISPRDAAYPFLAKEFSGVVI